MESPALLADVGLLSKMLDKALAFEISKGITNGVVLPA